MIDTSQFADRLKDSGFENPQAEGMARTLGDALARTVEPLATKSDLETEITKVSARIEALGTKVEALDAKVDALGTQIKFVFAALAMLLALGLIDTVPRLLS